MPGVKHIGFDNLVAEIQTHKNPRTGKPYTKEEATRIAGSVRQRMLRKAHRHGGHHR